MKHISRTKRAQMRERWWTERRKRENRDAFEVTIQPPVRGCVERRLVRGLPPSRAQSRVDQDDR